MTNAEQRRRMRQSLTWGKRLLIVVLILMAISYGVLKMAERSKDSVRLGLEDYLEQVTGKDAEITDLPAVRFTPDTILKMQGVLIREQGNKEKMLLRADEAYIAMPFWHLLFGIHKYEALEVKKLEIASDFLLPKKLTIRTAGITGSTSVDIPSYFIIEGSYNNHPLLITAEMLRDLRKGREPLYSFSRRVPITFKFGPLEGSGLLLRGSTQVALKDGILTRDVHKMSFVLDRIDINPLNIHAMGTINDVPFNAELTKSGETSILKIITSAHDNGSLLKIRNFVGDVRKDLGIEEENETLKIEIVQGKPVEELEQK